MNLYIFGAGGNGRELFHIINRRTSPKDMFDNICFIDRRLHGKEVYGRSVYLLEEVAARKGKEDIKVIISPSDPVIRLEMYDALLKYGLTIYSNVRDNSCYRKIGVGVADWGCHVLADAEVGNACLLGTNAVLSHDVVIGEGTHIGCNAFVGGSCKIGKGVLIGPGAVIRHNLKIGDYATIGMGSLILKNVPQNSVVMEKSSPLVLRDRRINNFD